MESTQELPPVFIRMMKNLLNLLFFYKPREKKQCPHSEPKIEWVIIASLFSQPDRQDVS